MMPPLSSQNDQLSIGLVSPGWPAEAMPNGIVSYTAGMVKGLQGIGARCHVLTSRLSGGSTADFVHVFHPDDRSLRSKVMWRVDPEGWQQQTACAALLKELKRLHGAEGLDLLELEESYGWPRLLAGRSPVPMVVRLHGPWFLNGAANGVPQDRAFHRRDRWEKAGLMSADAVSAPSRHVLQQTRAHFGLALPDAQVIPNPVEPVGESGRWNLQGCARNRIAFIGRFDRHKGGDTILEAFRAVVKQVPDAQLDFVGPDRGYIDDAGRTWKIEQYLGERLSPGERAGVTYHGFQPGSRGAEIRKQALVTVAPSRYETFGIAAAEAMMAGCPLVVCGAGALTELVQDGTNGLIARPGDGDDVADRILALMRNPDRAAALGAQAAEDAQRRYSPHVVARQTLEFYQKVLGRRGKAKESTRPSEDVVKASS